MNITLEQARCFCALAETGGYQAAARELNKSHSAIVYAINCFEKQSGLRLLSRNQYRTSLTAEGKKVYNQCRLLLEAAAQLEQACTDLTEGWEPSVRLVYDGILSPAPFLDLFRFFKQQKIPTTLGIFSDFLQGVEKSFVELEAEFMISVLNPRQANLVSIELKPLTNWLVAHRDHELNRNRRPWTVQELKKFNFFTVRGADTNLNLGTKELEETSTFHMGDFGLKKTAILQGVGFGWLPEYLIQEELRLEVLKPIHCELATRQELFPRLYHRRKKGLGRAAQVLLKQLAHS